MTNPDLPELVIPRLKETILDASQAADFAFSFDLDALAAALGNMPPDTVKMMFRDARRTSVLMEHLLIHHLGAEDAPDSNASYDIETEFGNVEVKCLTNNGLMFAPSRNYGSGRSFEPATLLKRLDSIIGYYVADIRFFPRVRVSVVPSDVVRSWWARGVLTTSNSAKLPAKRARDQIDSMLRASGIKLAEE